MKYNNLGKTGLLVSELCFGTMTFGGRGRWKAIGEQGQQEADLLIKTAVDHGINFIDTANAYSEGASERILGQSLKNLGIARQEAVIATKLRIRMGEGVNQVGLSRGHIYDSVNDSLNRLQLDHIDLLYIHGVDPLSPLEETMRGLEDVVRSGKIRYLGVCNHPAWMVAKANAIADKMGWTPFSALQYYYSLAGRDIENTLIPYAESEGLSVLPWSPLAGGFLSGKFDRETETTGNSRRDAFDFPPVNKAQAYDIIDVLRKIAQARQVSVAQVAIAWVMHQPTIHSTIIGARTLEQLTDNLAAVELKLTEEELAQLKEVSKTPQPYPNWMVGFQGNDREI